MDLNSLMEMAKQMRERLAGAQEEARKQTVTGESGGGMVRVVMNGHHELLELHIEPKAAEDVQLLEDLVRAAVNQASQRVEEALKDRMGEMAKNLGVDPNMLGGLGG